MTTYPGVDYSVDHPKLSALQGYDFVCRYLGAGLFTKGMAYNEAASLSANGHSIVSNWEGTGKEALKGKAQGVSDASRAATYHLACGGNPSSPIYFSVDFDTRVLDAAQWSSVEAYFAGIASVIGWERIGVYGGYNLIEIMHTRGWANYFWQTYAWSNGAWSTHAHIRQTKNGVQLGGGEVDLDTAMVADYGQWRIAMGQPLSDADESKLADIDYTLLHAQDPAHPGVAIPFHVWATQLMGMVETLTVQVQTLSAAVQALQSSGGTVGASGTVHVVGDLTVGS